MSILDPQSADFLALTPFAQLVEIMQALRSPQGCPWDRVQTHQTLKRYLLEETYETLEAIENEDFGEMCSELGDLLLQIVFHSQLAREAGHFHVDDVCQAIVDKMVRRHPHVFGTAQELNSAEEVRGQWEEIKKREKPEQKEDTSILAGLPRTLPALQLAERIQGRAAQVGFEFADPDAAWVKLQEELSELKASPSADELGDVLFACVSLARQLKVDPEAALRGTCLKFRDRFQKVEGELGAEIGGSSPERLLAAWERAKR